MPAKAATRKTARKDRCIGICEGLDKISKTAGAYVPNRSTIAQPCSPIARLAILIRECDDPGPVRFVDVIDCKRESPNLYFATLGVFVERIGQWPFAKAPNR